MASITVLPLSRQATVQMVSMLVRTKFLMNKNRDCLLGTGAECTAVFFFSTCNVCMNICVLYIYIYTCILLHVYYICVYTFFGTRKDRTNSGNPFLPEAQGVILHTSNPSYSPWTKRLGMWNVWPILPYLLPILLEPEISGGLSGEPLLRPWPPVLLLTTKKPASSIQNFCKYLSILQQDFSHQHYVRLNCSSLPTWIHLIICQNM